MSSHPGARSQSQIPTPPSLVVNFHDNDSNKEGLQSNNYPESDIDSDLGDDANGDTLHNQPRCDFALGNASASTLLLPTIPIVSSSSLSLPTMGVEEDDVDSSPMAPAANSPFNFKTQVISTAPVKSVCPPLSPDSSRRLTPL